MQTLIGPKRHIPGPSESYVGFIEYRREKEFVVPFSVLVFSDLANNRISGTYDFDWCERDGVCYFNMSGWGGELCPGFGARAEFWCGVTFDLLWPETAVIHPEPLQLYGGVVINPFDDDLHSCPGEAVYCRRCKDRIPDDSPCDHIWWCDNCGVWSGWTHERCKCRKPQ